MHTITLPRRVTAEELPRTADVMARAFLDDPLWVHAISDRDKRTRLLPKFFKPMMAYGHQAQRLFAAGDPLEGVAIWSEPEREVPLFGVRSLGILFTPLLFAFPRTIPYIARFDTLMKKYATEPHFYLNTIGIQPESQGKGLASKLIRPFLAQADSQGVPTYTETMTPSNVPLYEYYGFKVMEQLDFPQAGLSLWSLYRPVPVP